MRRCKCPGSWKSFLSCTSQLSGDKILLLSFLGGSWQLLGCKHCFPLWVHWGSEIHIWKPKIVDGCDILLYLYGRKYSISQTDILFLGYCEISLVTRTLFNYSTPVLIYINIDHFPLLRIPHRFWILEPFPKCDSLGCALILCLELEAISTETPNKYVPFNH